MKICIVKSKYVSSILIFNKNNIFCVPLLRNLTMRQLAVNYRVYIILVCNYVYDILL